MVKAGVKSNCEETTDWDLLPHIADREAIPETREGSHGLIYVRKADLSLIFKRSRKLSFVSLRSLQQKYNYINILQLSVIHVSDPFINFM